MTNLSIEERLKVYAAVNPNAVTKINTVDLLELMDFASEGGRTLQKEKAILNRAKFTFAVSIGISVINLFIAAFS